MILNYLKGFWMVTKKGLHLLWEILHLKEVLGGIK